MGCNPTWGLSGDATLSRQPKQTSCSWNSGGTPDPDGHRHVKEMRGAGNIFSPSLQFSISVDAKHSHNDDDNQSPVERHCQHNSPVYEARETITNHGPLRGSRWKIPCRQPYIILPLSGLLWGVTLPGPILLDLDQTRPSQPRFSEVNV